MVVPEVLLRSGPLGFVHSRTHILDCVALGFKHRKIYRTNGHLLLVKQGVRVRLARTERIARNYRRDVHKPNMGDIRELLQRSQNGYDATRR